VTKYKTTYSPTGTVYVHRKIFKEAYGYLPNVVDHKDRDITNNDPNNLRPANHSKNGLNRGKQKNNKSGFKGVSLCKCTGKYSAFFRRRRLGRYDTPAEAYDAYCKASIAYDKEFHHG
jgi:hypothetical protein